MNDDQGVPLWRKLVGVAVALGFVAVLVIFHSRLPADFWPPDDSRISPNLVASLIQAAIVFLLLVLLWPPWRRRLHRFVDRKLAPIHEHIKHQKAHNEWMAQLQAEAHRKIHGTEPPPHPHFDLAPKQEGRNAPSHQTAHRQDPAR